jgi:hypothetical protein
MFIQHDPEHPNLAIKVDDTDAACLAIHAIPFKGGVFEPKVINLTPFQGGPFRLYLDGNGELSTDLYGDHYWLLAETILPDKQYDTIGTGEVDDNGQEVTALLERPLDLNDIGITVFPLPEVE